MGLAAIACSDDDTGDPSSGAGATGGSGCGQYACAGASSGGTGGTGTGSGGTGGTGAYGTGGTGTGSGGTGGTGTGGTGTGGTGTGGTGTGGTGTGGTGGVDYDSGDGPCTPASPELPTTVPAILAVPAGAVLERKVHAVGTQNYKCTATAIAGDAGYSYAWVFVNPEAKMYDSCGTQVGTHSAPSGPTHPVWVWTADGSLVEGARDQQSAVAGAIAELLLHATNHVGTGIFSSVTYIQRLETIGGVAPEPSTCTAANVDELRKVDYSAYYYFYSGPPDGGT